MAKGTGGTIYLIGLIFAIVVAFVLLGVAYYMNTKWTETSNLLADALKDRDREKAEVKRLQGDVAQLNKIINGENSQSSYDQIATNHLAEANKSLQMALSDEWVSAVEWQNIKDPTVKEVWEKLTQFKDKSDKYTNLMEFQADCLNLLKMTIHVIPRLRLAQYEANDLSKNLQKQLDEIKTQKENELREAGQKYSKLQDESIENQRKAEIEKKRLQDQVEAMRKEETRLKKEQTNAVARLENEIKNRQRRIDELTKKQRKSFYEVSQPDGEITFADNQLGYAWIDIGKTHGLRRGTRFDIYNYTKGGRQKIKAYCEVKKVEQEMAQVAILTDDVPDLDQPDHPKHAVDPNDPIVKGDLIRSAVFEKDAQPKFYFLGQKLQNRYYTKEELVKKIEEFGGKVLKDLSVDVDYVVVLLKGEEDVKNYDLGTQLGATFMREDELLDYIGK